jgi:ferric-dicitrate binding protein FerR (iron transport regulator)
VIKPNPDIDRLLVKKLLGEASPEEILKADEWRSMNPDNQKYYEDFQKIWDKTNALAPDTKPLDGQEAWERFQQSARFPASTSKVIAMHPRKPYFRQSIATAAVLVLLAGGSVFWWYTARNTAALSIRTETATLTDTLPDGSQITLNKFSSLTYPRQFKGNTRTVTLEGEGFFHIAPNSQQPFQVETNGVKILVLGTSFNVKSKNGQTEVIVETGKVEVLSGSQQADINPGERVLVSANHTKLLKTAENDELYQYYRTREFVCQGTPLWKLTEALSEAYNVRITIEDNNTRNLPLTTTFKDESLDSILDVVTQTLSLTVSRKGSAIILK